MKGAFNVLVGGEAGQGLQTVGLLLSKSLTRSGYWVRVTQSYESRVRGGHNTFAIRFSPDRVAAPQEPVDLLLALTPETVELHRHELSPEGCIIADEAFGAADEVCLNAPYAELATSKFRNVAAMGVAGAVLGLDEQLMAGTIGEHFGRTHPETVQQNREVLSQAFRWGAEHPASIAKPSPPAETPRRIVLNGNEAVALGAMSAGVRFCSFYPMSPATSISVTLAGHAEKAGLVVEQAEDEIAAINMAVGASFAGAPSMVATSGGGFALMVETVSLAGITETPVVIVVGQRAGPATGMATRTEQADLEFVLHAGHGEFPRAVFAPGTVEECFHLTRKAFELAERYQGPMFVLSDHLLADSYASVEPFEVMKLAPVRIAAEPAASLSPYRRYAITESGVSPRLLPGVTEHLVAADSHEHTEGGHITEQVSVRAAMVEKRLRKGDGLRAEALAPEHDGDSRPSLLLVCWGSTKGSVIEAAARLRAEGEAVATLHFSQVWPLAPEQFVERLTAAGEVVCVEGNATGQLARLIRRETGFAINRLVLRYDGRPLTPEYIIRELNR